jgi:hypothetical protein
MLRRFFILVSYTRSSFHLFLYVFFTIIIQVYIQQDLDSCHAN